MPQRTRRPPPFEGLPFPGFARTVSGPLGCLLLVVLLPIALLTLLFVSVRGLLRAPGTASARRRRPHTPKDTEQEVALCSLVRGLALDETFTREEAGTAGVMVSSERTVDEMLDESLRRGWVERRPGDRLAVTAEGRREAERFLRARDL